ncbi:hypothetical protein BH09GEM1_BH09GEM1_07580 [soil metagenome]
MDHPLKFMVITEDGTLSGPRYSLTGDASDTPAHWEKVVEHLKRVSVYPGAAHQKAVIRLALFRKGRLGTEMSSRPSRLYAYALPTGRHLFLAEYDGVPEGMLFDIVNQVPFADLTFTAGDLAVLMKHPAGTVRTFAFTHLLPLVP